jgi:hypothetical protein
MLLYLPYFLARASQAETTEMETNGMETYRLRRDKTLHKKTFIRSNLSCRCNSMKKGTPLGAMVKVTYLVYLPAR